MQKGSLHSSAIVAALLVAELTLYSREPVPRMWGAVFAKTVALYSQVRSFLSICTVAICLTSLLIINEFITGMSESLSYFYWRARFLRRRCYSLLSGFVTGRSRLSTKITSEQYSDL